MAKPKMPIKISPMLQVPIGGMGQLGRRLQEDKDRGGGIIPGSHPELAGRAKNKQAGEDWAYMQDQWARVNRSRAQRGLPALPKPKKPRGA